MDAVSRIAMQLIAQSWNSKCEFPQNPSSCHTREFPITAKQKNPHEKGRTPAWLRQADVFKGSFQRAFVEGVRALIAAAESGAPTRRAAQVELPSGAHRQASLQDRLCHLPERAQLGADALRAPSGDLGTVLVRRLLPELRRVMPWVSEPMTPTRLVRRLSQAREMWRTTHKSPVAFDASEPFQLLRSAYQLLCQLKGRTGLPSYSQLMALMLIGIAVRGVRAMTRCKVCFRWAVPGHVHCHEHSRASVGRGTASERAARLRRAERAWPTYCQAVDSSPGLATRVTRERLPIVVGRALWNLRTADEDAMLRVIARTIMSSPRLAELEWVSGRRLASTGTLKLLRCHLDPYEWDAAAWTPKLRAAQAWFDVMANRPGHRGVGRGMSSRLLVACWLAEGGFDRRDIARYLKASPGAVSNWLSRYAVEGHRHFVLTRRLAAALAAPRPTSMRRKDRARM